ncbi:hypothetical protein ILYODFUR_034204 [Ilyodon furcidens]|uniref:Uncharacterized protein n=1 Tax=Ilyodon furcidens TaxID=33524 RepID=A0ABV0ULP3_9TELE
MSAEQQMFPSLYSSPRFAAVGAVEGAGAVEPVSSPLSELETFRMFLNERLTAAVEDILGLFGKTVARYREQIDCQQRELDNLRSVEGEWSRSTGSFVSTEQIVTAFIVSKSTKTTSKKVSKSQTPCFNVV